MIRITIGNNVARHQVSEDENITLREACEKHGIDYTVGVMNLDGCALKPGDLNKTFADLGFDGTEGHDTCYLLNVVKADNAR